MFPYNHAPMAGDGGAGAAILEYGNVSEWDSGADAPSPGQQREPVQTALHHRQAIVPFTLAPAQVNDYRTVIGRSYGFAGQLRPVTPLQRITLIYQQWDMTTNQNPYAVEPVIGPTPPYWCQPDGIG